MSAALEMGNDNYKLLGKIGEGGQGIIIKARRKKDNEIVAIKKLRNASDSNGISMETIREIYMLRELQHENIIKIIDIFGQSDNLYIIMPFAIGDLENIIKNKDILLTSSHIKQYMKMLFSGVEYIHNKFILHRDLKPSNCLILPNNTLQISDFGLSREYGSPNRLLSYQACTIWYRSPELLFGTNYYSIGLDIWSVGCIFAELLLRIPIFGGNDNSEITQIGRIFRILGTPNDISLLTNASGSNNNNNNNNNNNGINWKDYELLPKFRKFEPNKQYPIDNLFKASSKNEKELFLNLCKYDPNQRLSATKALKHAYFKEKPAATPIHLLPKLPNNDKLKNNNTKMEID
eukprot:296148_1